MDASAVYGGGPVDLPSGVVAEVVRTAVARSSPADAPQAVIEMAVETGPSDAVSITLLAPDRSVDTVVHSMTGYSRPTDLQYEFGEGPCVDAIWTDGAFTVPDLLADGRWPRWAPEAARLGIGASVTVHFFTDSTLGSINMYSLTPREFTETDMENARVIAAHASVVLAYRRQNDNLWRAIDARNPIGQPQGILMERYGLAGPKAFAVLRRPAAEREDAGPRGRIDQHRCAARPGPRAPTPR